ncbi:hypothetical protein HJ526_06365 [Donghicola sp. C2-DW-16]|uniref:Uncharacterized protein n=1 Tax=Donghicola mangrovi TaxID=2729614 RepID=A0A850Q9N9_9RHOB|nr:hypothetical protein [Donghicola mangrovi]NVO23510.1 hypothetical protein [Donghicola mangrovi]NVO27032.1 hypothetical protein [Donghicola mangrovi]
MSAPDTNLESQKNQHKPSLWGIGAAVTFGVAMIAIIVFVSVGANEQVAEDGAPTDTAPAAVGVN